MRVRFRTLLAFLAAALLVFLGILLACRPDSGVQAQLAGVVGPATPATPDTFARAQGPHPLLFPADHGPHVDYQTEWWYYTGNLETAQGRHFGFQLTFFRRALLPPDQRPQRDSNWATDQVYMAHFALSDVEGRQFYASERFSRGAAGLAGAQSPPYQVWLENWRVEQVDPNTVRLHAAQDDLSLDLQLEDVKGPILQGDRGYSQKGPDPGNASYYYSQTRLETSGTVQIAAATYAISGWSWMDHEFSTSALAPEQVGWDWFSLQLDDGSELMVFQIRRADGQIDPFSSGTFIGADGRTISLEKDDFAIQIGESWRSPHSRATYPAGWIVQVPRLDLILEIEPYMADQELNLSYSYWEGAVRIAGQREGRPVSGSGYVELTGYAGSMQGQF